jgi:hypothetical protein
MQSAHKLFVLIIHSDQVADGVGAKLGSRQKSGLECDKCRMELLHDTFGDLLRLLPTVASEGIFVI